jgi:hypothetical protein
MFKVENGYDYGKVLSCLINNKKDFTVTESRLVDGYWKNFDIQCELTQLDEYNFNLVYGDQETNIVLVKPIGMNRRIWIDAPKYEPKTKTEYLDNDAYRILYHLDQLRRITGEPLVATISARYGYKAIMDSDGNAICEDHLLSSRDFLVKRYEVSEHAKSECNLLGNAVWVQQ